MLGEPVQQPVELRGVVADRELAQPRARAAEAMGRHNVDAECEHLDAAALASELHCHMMGDPVLAFLIIVLVVWTGWLLTR